jgi:HD-GYP domain-containing protein (c-di-GMP phosphodiesterase class II)
MGYPAGLAGEEIPLGARVIFVADAYDAMTSDRAYRGRLTPQDAIAELERCAGTQFDPHIVTVFARELGYSPATAVAAR